MKIGELAAQSSTLVETIRYYEREGLLPAPPRTEGNFRAYDDTHLERLQFIRYCRSLDMSLAEIRQLLSFKDAPQADCGDVNALLDEHIAHVATRLRELRALDKQLRALRARCDAHRSTQQCGVLEGLAQAAHERPACAPARSDVAPVHRRP